MQRLSWKDVRGRGSQWRKKECRARDGSAEERRGPATTPSPPPPLGWQGGRVARPCTQKSTCSASLFSGPGPAPCALLSAVPC
jgi:hypothetical protein